MTREDADEERGKHGGNAGSEFRPRQEQAAIVEKAAARQRDAAARSGSDFSTALYQNSSCSSSGTLRITST